jgi:pimeloyl-ACP methyl ester carboxylesterase
MGGMVAQSFVARCFGTRRLESGHPVAGLVLLASTAPAQLGPAIDTPFPTDRPFLFDRETTTQRYFHSTPSDRLERALDRLVPESTAVINEILAPPGVSIESSRITCPVLSVTAGFDGTSVPKDGALAEYYGGEHIHDAENGHDLMLEAGWEPLLERILDWVNRRVGKP